MNRRIPNGSWCLFRKNPAGSRQGKVVLVQQRDIADSDDGGHFTVKVYESMKAFSVDGTWQHDRILLKPDSLLPGYSPIEIFSHESDEFVVIAEFIAVIGAGTST